MGKEISTFADIEIKKKFKAIKFLSLYGTWILKKY